MPAALQIIDGKDLTPVMTQVPNAKSAHTCLMQYHAGADGPGAVR